MNIFQGRAPKVVSKEISDRGMDKSIRTLTMHLLWKLEQQSGEHGTRPYMAPLRQKEVTNRRPR